MGGGAHSLNPRLLALVPTVTAGLADNTRMGSFWVRLNVLITPANTNVNVLHGLGRKPSGYLVMGQRQAGSVYDDGTHTGWDHEGIVVKASAAGTYDLWIV